MSKKFITAVCLLFLSGSVWGMNKANTTQTVADLTADMASLQQVLPRVLPKPLWTLILRYGYGRQTHSLPLPATFENPVLFFSRPPQSDLGENAYTESERATFNKTPSENGACLFAVQESSFGFHENIIGWSISDDNIPHRDDPALSLMITFEFGALWQHRRTKRNLTQYTFYMPTHGIPRLYQARYDGGSVVTLTTPCGDAQSTKLLQQVLDISDAALDETVAQNKEAERKKESALTTTAVKREPLTTLESDNG